VSTQTDDRVFVPTQFVFGGLRIDADDDRSAAFVKEGMPRDKHGVQLRVAAANSTGALDRAVVEHRRHAAQAWWSKAHLDFLSDFPDGPDHEQFNNMLMGL
jgi:hypothetical protein